LKAPLHGKTAKELTSANITVNAQSKNAIATMDIEGYTIILFSYPMYLDWSGIIRGGTKVKSPVKSFEQIASLIKKSYASNSIIDNEEKGKSIIETTE